MNFRFPIPFPEGPLRIRIPSLEGNIMGIVDGVSRYNVFKAGIEISKFLDEFNWANILDDVQVGRLELKTLPDGNVSLYRNGARIDEVKVQNAMRSGDLLTGIREMKFEVDDSVVAYAKRYETTFRNSEGFKAGKAIDDYKPVNVPEPPNLAAVEAQLKADARLAARFEEGVKKLESKVDGNGYATAGRWLKRSVYLGLGALAVAFLYDKVREHQALMNGCWLLDLTSADPNASKCKLPPLTCSDADLTSTEVQAFLCSAAQEGLSCGAEGTPCFGDSVCVGYDENKECNSTLGSTRCAEGVCHPACSSTNHLIEVPSSHRLVCVHMNFWDAFEDFADETLDHGVGLLQKVVIAALFLLAGYLVFKVAWSSSSSSSSPAPPAPSLQP